MKEPDADSKPFPLVEWFFYYCFLPFSSAPRGVLWKRTRRNLPVTEIPIWMLWKKQKWFIKVVFILSPLLLHDNHCGEGKGQKGPPQQQYPVAKDLFSLLRPSQKFILIV
jgi:hypothetical protein